MKVLSRHKVSKHGSAKRFRKQIGKTKAANVKPMPMRGGFRF